MPSIDSGIEIQLLTNKQIIVFITFLFPFHIAWHTEKSLFKKKTRATIKSRYLVEVNKKSTSNCT